MSALKDLQALILWARKNQIAWSSLTCGTLHIEGGDMKPEREAQRSKPQDAQPAPTMYQRYGGALLEQDADAKAGSVQSSVVVEEEYEQ